jgi:DNA-binding MarR family transcriptional regulator
MSQQPELEALDFLLAQVCRLHHTRAQALLEGLGLYRGQPPVLRVLHEQEGMTHTELATRLRLTPATMTKMLQRMEKAGFVQRRPDSADQRVSRVYLTDAGRAIHAQALVVLGRLAEETLCDMTIEERVVLRRLLLQVLKNLGQALGGEYPIWATREQKAESMKQLVSRQNESEV